MQGVLRVLARSVVPVLLLCSAASAGDIEAQGKLPTPQEIDSTLRELSDITGFHVRKPLPFQMVTRDEVNQFLKEQIRRSVKPDEIRAEEITLRKFGFVGADFDLKKTTIDLLTEQAAAYYDFHRKKLFISDWAARNMRETALVHELAHALADQNFSIQRFLGKDSDNSEASLARETVVEGQASWLMIELEARRTGRTLADPATAAEFLKEDTGSEDSEYPVFNKAPLYVKKTLLFPYEQGEKFQQAVFLKSGRDAFSELFRKPPVSTSQVLHPERYFSHVEFRAPDLPKPIHHAKPFVTGTLGELDHRVLLQQYIDADLAGSLAPSLKASAYRIDQSKPDHHMMLLYASDWTDENAAVRYFDAYHRIMRAKWKHIEVIREDQSRFSGKCEDGYFELARRGTQVLSQEGFAQPLK